LFDLSVSQTQQGQVSRSVGPIVCAKRSLPGDFNGFHRRTAQVKINQLYSGGG
jgi:hypothetical protein